VTVTPAYLRFVALGDSFTEGLSDIARADGRPRGWADRLAAALATLEPDFDYANLAVRGKLLGQVMFDQATQLPDLLVTPSLTLVSFHAGANDVLRPRSDLPDLRSEYELAIREIVSHGATVMVFTVIPRAGGTGRTAARLASRFSAFNDGVYACVDRYGLTLVDLAKLDALQDRRLWNDDRLHLAPEGHRRVAAAALAALGCTDDSLLGGSSGWWRQPVPPDDTRSRGADLADDAQWVRKHLAPWVVRRMRGTSSGDGMSAKQPEPTHVVAAPLSADPE
jgi:lysophospholipase L1-like esterase